MHFDSDLIIYERRRLLMLEKELVALHHQLAALIRDIEESGPTDALSGLSSALWSLTEATTCVVQSIRSPEAPKRSCA